MKKESKKKKGQGMTEYILIVALIAVATILIVTIFGNQLRALFSTSAQQLKGDKNATIEDKTGGAAGAVEKDLDDIGK